MLTLQIDESLADELFDCLYIVNSHNQSSMQTENKIFNFFWFKIKQYFFALGLKNHDYLIVARSELT